MVSGTPAKFQMPVPSPAPISLSTATMLAMFPAPPASAANCPPGRSSPATVRNTCAWSGSQCSVATLTAASTGG